MILNNFKRKDKTPADEKQLSGYKLGSTIREKIDAQFQITGNKLNSWQDIIGKKTTSGIVIFLWVTSFCYFLYSILSVIIKH